MSNTHQLRFKGYIVNDQGHVEANREGERYEQSRVAIIQIDGSREIVDRLIAVADSPRALVGRSRDGSAVLVFRRDGERNFLPYNPNHQGAVFDLVMHSDGEPLRLVFGCGTLDPSVWTWITFEQPPNKLVNVKGRSLLETPRDSLPNLTRDVCDDIAREALKHAGDARAAREEAERSKAFEARRAKYLADLAKPKTAEQLQAEEDDEIITRYANEVLAWNDPDKPRLDAARSRIAARLKQTVAA
jgi:hypothetical protein